MNQVYTISQVNSYIKNMFQMDYALNRIYLKGEVSNCKYHTSGHIYFTLKDTTGQIACVMFAGQRSGLKFPLKEGQSVIALGSINVYERDGKYQLYAKEIVLDGSGVLHQQFEELKRKLYDEGLFDENIKKKINPYPRKIGIVTAKTGAAIQDISNIATRRNPYVKLVLYPALVQGEGAKESIVKGLMILDKMGLDTIIVGRGGGSIEDLWAFNEEIVARTIFQCVTPIISAVGHETDTTIADYVSDLRAPTPSAAAELAVGNITEFFDRIGQYRSSLNSIFLQKIVKERNKLDVIKMRLEFKNPERLILDKRQQIVSLDDRLHEVMNRKIVENKHKLEIYIEKIKGLSPLDKITKGYGYISNQDDKSIKSIQDVEIDDTVKVTLIDGKITTKVVDIERGGVLSGESKDSR